MVPLTDLILDAARWGRHNRDSSYLRAGHLLDFTWQLYTTYAGKLDEDVKEYVEASMKLGHDERELEKGERVQEYTEPDGEAPLVGVQKAGINNGTSRPWRASINENFSAPARLFALKQGDTFIAADAYGDITGEGDGFFHDDTRLLSRFRLSLAGRPLELLGGAVSRDNVVFTADLTNLPLPSIGGQSIRQGAIHFERTRVIWEDRLYERLRLRNLGQVNAMFPCGLSSPPISATCSRCAGSRAPRMAASLQLSWRTIRWS